MGKVKHVLTSRKTRFLIVGIANAAISFGILNVAFYYFKQNKIVSSLIGTSCALIFSFVLNRNFVFGAKTERVRKQVVPFVIVTVLGSLILLNIIYALMVVYLHHSGEWLTRLINSITHLKFSQNFIDINFSTVIGAAAALAWNYNGYRLFVFKDQGTHEKSIKEI